MIGIRRFTMSRLAERIAPHWSSSNQQTSEPNPVLQPLMYRQVQNALGINDYLPFLPRDHNTYREDPPVDAWWWENKLRDRIQDPDDDTNRENQLMSGGGDPRRSPIGGGVRLKPPQWAQPIGGDPEDPVQSPPPRRAGGRRTPVEFDPQPNGSGGDWVPQLDPWSFDPNKGFLDFNPQQIAGPSSLEDWAASNVKSLWSTPRASMDAYNVLQGIPAKTGGAVGDILDTPQGMGALARVNKVFEEMISPTVSNRAALMGLDRGTGETNALATAQASTLLPTIQQLLGLEEQGRARTAQTEIGRAGSLAQLGQQGYEQRRGSISDAAALGERGRSIANQRGQAGRDEWNRLSQEARQAAIGFLPGFIPNFGTQSSSSKPGLSAFI